MRLSVRRSAARESGIYIKKMMNGKSPLQVLELMYKRVLSSKGRVALCICCWSSYVPPHSSIWPPAYLLLNTIRKHRCLWNSGWKNLVWGGQEIVGHKYISHCSHTNGPYHILLYCPSTDLALWENGGGALEARSACPVAVLRRHCRVQPS
jgi:hypothetical protein